MITIYCKFLLINLGDIHCNLLCFLQENFESPVMVTFLLINCFQITWLIGYYKLRRHVTPLKCWEWISMSFITNFMWAVKIVPQADKKPLMIPICCTCLTITLILISEQPTTLFKWFNRTKMSQNKGCLANTIQDQKLKLGPKSHILFYKVFYD